MCVALLLKFPFNPGKQVKRTCISQHSWHRPQQSIELRYTIYVAEWVGPSVEIGLLGSRG